MRLGMEATCDVMRLDCEAKKSSCVTLPTIDVTLDVVAVVVAACHCSTADVRPAIFKLNSCTDSLKVACSSRKLVTTSAVGVVAGC